MQKCVRTWNALKGFKKCVEVVDPWETQSDPSSLSAVAIALVLVAVTAAAAAAFYDYRNRKKQPEEEPPAAPSSPPRSSSSFMDEIVDKMSPIVDKVQMQMSPIVDKVQMQVSPIVDKVQNLVKPQPPPPPPPPVQKTRYEIVKDKLAVAKESAVYAKDTMLALPAMTGTKVLALSAAAKARVLAVFHMLAEKFRALLAATGAAAATLVPRRLRKEEAIPDIMEVERSPSFDSVMEDLVGKVVEFQQSFAKPLPEPEPEPEKSRYELVKQKSMAAALAAKDIVLTAPSMAKDKAYAATEYTLEGVGAGAVKTIDAAVYAKDTVVGAGVTVSTKLGFSGEDKEWIKCRDGGMVRSPTKTKAA